MKKIYCRLLLIIFSSLCIKGFIVWLLLHHGSSFTQPDSASYLMPAIQMLHGGSLWMNSSLWMRSPGYPLFLALIFKMFGVHLVAVVIIQLLISSVLMINAYRIGAILRNDKAGLWAAAVVGVDYLLINFSNFILTDFLFAVIFSFIFYELILFMKVPHKRFRAALMVGVWLAVATWVRPISYYLPLLLMMMLMIYSWRTAPLSKMCIWLLLLMVPSFILVGSWQIRNKEVIGTYRYTGIDAINFYSYYAADIVAREKNISFEAAQAQLQAEADRHHLTGLQLNDYYRHEGLKILFTHPVYSACQVAVGAFHILVGVDSGVFYMTAQDWQHHNQLHSDLYHAQIRSFLHDAHGIDYVKFALIMIFYGANVFLIIASLYFVLTSLSSSTNRSAVILCLMIAGYCLLLSSNVCGYDRFRVPFQLILGCFAVLGVISFKHRNTRDTTSQIS